MLNNFKGFIKGLGPTKLTYPLKYLHTQIHGHSVWVMENECKRSKEYRKHLQISFWVANNHQSFRFQKTFHLQFVVVGRIICKRRRWQTKIIFRFIKKLECSIIRKNLILLFEYIFYRRINLSTYLAKV